MSMRFSARASGQFVRVMAADILTSMGASGIWRARCAPTAAMSTCWGALRPRRALRRQRAPSPQPRVERLSDRRADAARYARTLMPQGLSDVGPTPQTATTPRRSGCASHGRPLLAERNLWQPARWPKRAGRRDSGRGDGLAGAPLPAARRPSGRGHATVAEQKRQLSGEQVDAATALCGE